MLIKHFDNLAKLLDVMIADFVDLRHNCNTLWDDVETIDRRQRTAT